MDGSSGLLCRSHITPAWEVLLSYSYTNPYYYHVLEEFKKKTGCSVIVNTSFNVRGEPIVNTPNDAYRCFMRTDMDVLVLENCILYKEEQPEYKEEGDWRSLYTLD